MQFFDVIEGNKRAKRQAWSYEKPGAAMKKIKNWIGFWDEVEIK